MADIVSIRGKNKLVVTDCISLADDLELLAGRIRSGEVDAHRGVLVYEKHDTCIRQLALGPAITILEATGMLTRGMMLAWESTEDA